jgi:hypothetical protein
MTARPTPLPTDSSSAGTPSARARETSLGLHQAGLAIAVIDVAGGIAHANARMHRHWLTHGRRPATYRALRGGVGPYAR